MYSTKGMFSLYLLPLALVSKKLPIVLAPPNEAGIICSIVAVEAIKSLLVISFCVLLEYFTTKAFFELSDVGKNNALFLMSAKISFSFSFGIIPSRDAKNIFLLKKSLSLFEIIICLHFVVFALISRAVLALNL